jgi:arylsulfatase A-like enzyme
LAPATTDPASSGGTTASGASSTTVGGPGTSSGSSPSTSIASGTSTSSNGSEPTSTTSDDGGPEETTTTANSNPAQLVGPAVASRILVIVIDDLNDYVGFLNGLPDNPGITPNMDALAANGINYTDAHCSSPACASARPAMWWGIDPTVTGIYNNSHQNWWRSPVLGPGPGSARTRPSIFRRLRSAGFTTRGFGKIFHGAKLDTHDNDCWDDYINFGFSQPSLAAGAKLSTSTLGTHGTFGAQFSDQDFPDFKVAQAAAAAIATMPERSAYFVGIQKPHLPLVVPQKYFDAYTEAYGQVKPPFFSEDDLNDLPPAALSHFIAKRDQLDQVRANGELADLVHAYLASVSFADAMVGIVLDALAASPHGDDTTVVLTSDHGFAVGEKLSFTKFQLWEQGTRVPLVVRQPGAQAGIVDSAVSHLDLAPTLEELAGLTPVPYGEGLSLLDPVREPARHQSRVVLSSYMGERATGNIIGVSARDRKYSFIKYFTNGGDRRELYDRSSDSMELTNLARDTSNQAIMDRLEAFLPQQPAAAITN